MAAELIPNSEIHHFADHQLHGQPMVAQHCHRSPWLAPTKPEHARCSMQAIPMSPTAHYQDVKQEATTSLKEERMIELEQTVCTYADKIYSGDDQWVADAITQMQLEKECELVLLASIVVSKALDEPQHSEVCAIISKALQAFLPPLPPTHPGRKAERFMHVVLDAFQTEFEQLLLSPSASTEGTSSGTSVNQASPIDHSRRLRAACEFAGHLHCQGLLGSRVVSQMVHDLVGTGALRCARALLHMIGVSLENPERSSSLSAVVEEDVDGSDEEAS